MNKKIVLVLALLVSAQAICMEDPSIDTGAGVFGPDASPSATFIDAGNGVVVALDTPTVQDVGDLVEAVQEAVTEAASEIIPNTAEAVADSAPDLSETLSGVTDPISTDISDLPEIAKELPGLAEGALEGTPDLADATTDAVAAVEAKGLFSKIVSIPGTMFQKGKNGVCEVFTCVKNAPGDYIQLWRDNQAKATIYTAVGVVVVSGVTYVAYNWYKQRKEEKKRARQLLHKYETN